MRTVESIMAVSLFLIYLVLWSVKRKEILKSSGIDPEVLFKDTRPTQKYFSNMVKLMIVSAVVLIIIHSLNFSLLSITGQARLLDNILFDIAGFAIGLAGLLICRVAQVNMRNSWRVGIDPVNRTALVTAGLYKIIRNPTYPGLFIFFSGILLIFPSFIFAVWIFFACMLFEFQVRCEEEFLQSMHGEVYSEYCRKTKRYLPFIY